MCGLKRRPFPLDYCWAEFSLPFVFWTNKSAYHLQTRFSIYTSIKKYGPITTFFEKLINTITFLEIVSQQKKEFAGLSLIRNRQFYFSNEGFKSNIQYRIASSVNNTFSINVSELRTASVKKLSPLKKSSMRKISFKHRLVRLHVQVICEDWMIFWLWKLIDTDWLLCWSNNSLELSSTQRQ